MTKCSFGTVRLWGLVLGFAFLTVQSGIAAEWQFRAVVESSGKAPAGSALMWLPPRSNSVRGLFLLGQLGIESEFANDAAIRQVCAENDLAIVYFEPHISAVFHFWEPENRDPVRLLQALDELAALGGHAEVRRVPWITAGHSTAGIFCRNVAYWMPKRVAAVVHIKSGNFHQKDHLPPSGSLAGIPVLAINGQFEVFGPEGGIRPEFGRETQWTFVLRDLQQFRTRAPEHLMSLLVEPGADHYHGTPELARFVALFLAKTARYRLPRRLPPGNGDVECLPVRARDGWLSDPDIRNPRVHPAPYDKYRGEKNLGLWHYDEQMARAAAAFEAGLAHPQVIGVPVLQWLDDGDGWTLRASAQWLDQIPAEYGGNLAGNKVGHVDAPFVFRSKRNEPVERLGPDTFRLLRPVKTVNIAAWSPGDSRYASTIRWGSITPTPAPRGATQSIDFPTVADFTAGAAPQRLRATASSGLPVYYEVEYGPVRIDGGNVVADSLPARAKYPLECKITAYQIGRRVGTAIAPAVAVSRVFTVRAAP
jgi:hypothetical protein